VIIKGEMFLDSDNKRRDEFRM